LVYFKHLDLLNIAPEGGGIFIDVWTTAYKPG